MTELIRTSIAAPTPTETRTAAVNMPPSRLVYSDIRQKRDIRPLDILVNGLRLYRYRYRWSPTEYVGVLAQEVAAMVPDAVSKDDAGFLRVDYRRLGLQLRTYEDWLSKGHLALTPNKPDLQ